jgi:hypothetical protein
VVSIIGVIITALLEQQNVLKRLRSGFNASLLQYVRIFVTREFKNQREIRYAYLIACVPIILILLLIYIVLHKHIIIYFIFKLLILIFSVQVLTWKEEAKEITHDHKSFNFINTFATKFFAPLFWFLVLPGGIGVVAYLIIMSMSLELKNKGLDLVVYNIVVDKMLFYANVIPYILLYIFIAFAGDFENVSHYLLSQRKNFTKSFYFLDNMLYDAILIAVDKEKYDAESNQIDSNADAGFIKNDRLSVQMVKYIVAVLYRAGLFLIGVIILVAIAHILGLLA